MYIICCPPAWERGGGSGVWSIERSSQVLRHTRHSAGGAAAAGSMAGSAAGTAAGSAAGSAAAHLAASAVPWVHLWHQGRTVSGSAQRGPVCITTCHARIARAARLEGCRLTWRHLHHLRIRRRRGTSSRLLRPRPLSAAGMRPMRARRLPMLLVWVHPWRVRRGRRVPGHRVLRVSPPHAGDVLTQGRGLYTREVWKRGLGLRLLFYTGTLP